MINSTVYSFLKTTQSQFRTCEVLGIKTNEVPILFFQSSNCNSNLIIIKNLNRENFYDYYLLFIWNSAI